MMPHKFYEFRKKLYSIKKKTTREGFIFKNVRLTTGAQGNNILPFFAISIVTIGTSVGAFPKRSAGKHLVEN